MEQSLQQPINGWEKKFPACAVQRPFFPLTFWRKFAPEKTKAGWNL
jgi:hypothetical protein